MCRHSGCYVMYIDMVVDIETDMYIYTELPVGIENDVDRGVTIGVCILMLCLYVYSYFECCAIHRSVLTVRSIGWVTLILMCISMGWYCHCVFVTPMLGFILACMCIFRMPLVSGIDRVTDVVWCVCMLYCGSCVRVRWYCCVSIYIVVVVLHFKCSAYAQLHCN